MLQAHLFKAGTTNADFYKPMLFGFAIQAAHIAFNFHSSFVIHFMAQQLFLTLQAARPLHVPTQL
jgi:hypothetical protein